MRPGEGGKLPGVSFFEFEFDPLQASLRIFSEPTFPYTYYSPAQPSEFSGGLSVPSLGTFYFVLPCLSICFGSNVLAAVVPVPEASVDKDGHL